MKTDIKSYGRKRATYGIRTILVFVCLVFFVGVVSGRGEGSASDFGGRYALTPSDEIRISIFGQPDLSGLQKISAIGTVALPFVGEVEVAGLTAIEAQRKIGAAYVKEEFLVNPVVEVKVEKHSVGTITVLGEVSSPGVVSLPIGVREMEIHRFIGLVGDFTDIAKTTSVRVERQLDDRQKPEVFFVDVKILMESSGANRPDEAFQVRDGDVIYVPRRLF